MQFAVKRLTMSDLTLFARQYRKSQEAARVRGQGGSKQKGINLNADVFVDIVFPLARGNGEKRRFLIPRPTACACWSRSAVTAPS
jgi:hypothetical protein